jgi:hypothetical protein
MLPSDEVEILGRVERRFFADERVSADGSKKSISMPTALAMVLIASARQDIAKGRREPRRFTRREATDACLSFIETHGTARRRGKTVTERLEAQWTRTDKRVAEKLCAQVFHDPESGADVRFVPWDRLPPLPSGVKAIYYVKPLFTWPPPARPLDPFEVAAFILGCALLPVGSAMRYVELSEVIEYFLTTQRLAFPRQLQEKIRAYVAEPLRLVFKRQEVLFEVETHLRDHPFDGARSSGDVRMQWFEIGRDVATFVLLLVGPAGINSESARASHVHAVHTFTESLRAVSMAALDRQAFGAFIQILRRESFGPEAAEEALELLRYFSQQWFALGDAPA